jgi:hypothetical protein
MYDVGDPVEFAFELPGAATVTLTVELPDGTSATPTVSAPGVGRYTATYTPTQAGLHRFRWAATGAFVRAYSDVFNVRSAADLQLVSLAAVKAHLNMSAATVDDEELRGWIAAATRVVERHTGETIARRSVTETRTGPRVLLSKRPVLAVSSPSGATVVDAALGEVLVTTTGDVEIVYTAGYREVPENYLGAAAIIAAHLFETQRNATVGQQVNLAGDVQAFAPSGQGYAIPRRAEQLLGARPPVVA